MKKPIIGVLGICEEPGLTPRYRTVLNVEYTRAVEKNGGIPIVIPFTEDFAVLRESLGICHGVLLPGGIDSDPALFGEPVHPGCEKFLRVMDDMHLAALEYLFAHNVPVLGICRGCQLMNIFAGGTLYQDLGEFPLPTLRHRQDAALQHEVEVVPDSCLEKLLGQKIVTNSFHHQAVKRIGSGLTVSANARDGVIEAIEHENGIWLGVQWHPERMTETSPEMNVLFRDLVEKAKKKST